MKGTFECAKPIGLVTRDRTPYNGPLVAALCEYKKGLF